MEYRTLCKTGVEVSEIGFGAWAIGGDAWGPVEDENSIRAMERAIDLGITFIDTADVYGDGHSESLVARVLKGRRDTLVVSTKGGLMGHHRDPKKGAVYDQPAKVIEAFEASLRRLETDYIDVYFCHLWWDNEEEIEAFLAAFEQLKRDGKVRAVGVSTDSFNHIKHYNQTGGLDVVQLDYSILNRNAEKEIFPYVQEQQIGVVVRAPLKMGVLTGKFSKESSFPEGDIRQNWPNEQWFQDSLRQVEQLRSLERGRHRAYRVARPAPAHRLQFREATGIYLYDIRREGSGDYPGGGGCHPQPLIRAGGINRGTCARRDVSER